MKKFIVFYLILAAAIGVEILADTFLKKSGASNLGLFFAGMILYGLTAFPVVYLFKKADFEVLFMIWEAFGILLGLAVATFYFQEPFTARKTLALTFSLGALICSYL